METEKDIKSAIIEAFSDVSRPIDTEVVSIASDIEAKELYNLLQNKTWQDVLNDLTILEGPEFYYYHSVYGFFTPKAFKYYLPAFMIISLDPVRADIVCEYLIFRLAPSKAMIDWHSEFVKILTVQQQDIIKRFLLYLWDVCHQIDYGDVTDVPQLRSFWFPEGFPRLLEAD